MLNARKIVPIFFLIKDLYPLHRYKLPGTQVIGGNISTVGILEHPQILFDKIQFVRCADHEPSQVIDLQIANEPRHSRN